MGQGKGKRTRLAPELVRKMKALYLEGHKQEDIARMCGVSITTAAKYCRRWNASQKQHADAEIEINRARRAVAAKQIDKVTPVTDLTQENFQAKELEIKYNAMRLFNNMINELNARLGQLTDEQLKSALLEIWERIKS